MWHGQHFMISFAWPRSIDRMAALISRHGDGGVNAVALRRLGVQPIRGSGGRAERMRRKGGVPAMREMLRALSTGVSVAITADVPKRARVAGAGIVALARLSGRPIAPTAVVTSRRFDLKSWDRASLGKPFGHGAIVVGDLIHVAPDADEASDGGGAQSGRGGARRRSRARLCQSRRRRSWRRPEARMKLPVSLVAYRLATGAFAPAAGPLLSWRLSRGKEDGARIAERRGANRASSDPLACWSGCTARASAKRFRCFP